MGCVIVVLVALLVAAAPPAFGLKVTGVRFANNRLSVKGAAAVPRASIAWGGRAVARASAGGRFRFTVATPPDDCVVALSDGATTVRVVSPLCGPHASGSATGGVPPVVVRDANGALVGVVTSADWGRVEVTRRASAGQAIRLVVSPFGFVPESPSLSFAGTDCTGAAFFKVWPYEPSFSFIPSAAVHDGTAYYPLGWPAQRPIQSRLSFTDQAACAGSWTPPDRCCEAAPFAMAVLAATYDVSRFVAPFRIEAPPIDGLGSPGPAFVDVATSPFD